jgi:tetratricopeptide (TPR) repeat protein
MPRVSPGQARPCASRCRSSIEAIESDLDAEIVALADEAVRRVEDGDPGSGLLLAQRAVERANLNAGPAAGAAAQRALGKARFEMGDYGVALRAGEAARTLDTVADEAGPRVGEDDNLIGVSALTLGDLARSTDVLRSAATRLEQTLGPDHELTIQALNNLGGALARAGEARTAEAVRRDALARAERVLGDHRQTALLLNSLAVGVGRDPGRAAEGLELAQRAIEVARRALRPDHPLVCSLSANVAINLANRGDPDAPRLIRDAVHEHERAFGPEHPNLAFVLLALAGVTDDRDEARRATARATLIRLRALGPTARPTLDALRQAVRYFAPQPGGEDVSPEATEIYRQWAALEPEAAPVKLVLARRSTPDEAAAVLARTFERYLGESPLADQIKQAVAADYRLADDAATAGDYGPAIAALERAVHRIEAAKGVESAELVEALRRLDAMCLAAGQEDQLLEVGRRIAHATAAAYGPNHPVAVQALVDYARRELHEHGALSEETATRASAAVRATFVAPRAERLAEHLYGTSAHARRREVPLSVARRHALQTIAATGPLADLHEADWVGARHAYGPAIDTPNELRLLRADDAGVRADALGRLANSLCHQGSVYPASAVVVPFLARLALDHDQPDRADIVWLLAMIAAGVGRGDTERKVADEIRGAITLFADRLRALTRESPELNDAVGELNRALATRVQ